MSKAEVMQWQFSVRFERGYRFLDRCGEALIRLEEELDERWIPTESAPTGGQMKNEILGLTLLFNSNQMNVVQDEFIDFELLTAESGKALDILRATFEVGEYFTPTLFAQVQRQFAATHEAEDWLYSLGLFGPDEQMLALLGGDREALSCAVTTTSDETWGDEEISRRRRVAARGIRQQRTRKFDQRLIQRVHLLSAHQQEVLKGLKQLEVRHPPRAEFAAQFEFEQSFEIARFQAELFDTTSFLSDSRQWVDDCLREIMKGKR